MSSRIFTQIPECDPNLVAAIGEQSMADLHEAMETIRGRMALFDSGIRPLQPGLNVAGQALTVAAFPGDGLLGHKALSLAKPGQVLVQTAFGGFTGPQFAELVSLAAKEAGVVGAVIDGPVRDTDALLANGFPVWCRGAYAARPLKRGPGEVNVPLVCGGVYVEPGDIIVADGDGAIAIPLASAEKVLAGAQARAEREVGIRAAIADGTRLYDLLGLEQQLDKDEYVEIDGTWQDNAVTHRSEY